MDNDDVESKFSKIISKGLEKSDLSIFGPSSSVNSFIEYVVEESSKDSSIVDAFQGIFDEFDKELEYRWNRIFRNRREHFYPFIPEKWEQILLNNLEAEASRDELLKKLNKMVKSSTPTNDEILEDLLRSFYSLHSSLHSTYYGSRYYHWDNSDCELHNSLFYVYPELKYAVFTYIDPETLTTTEGRIWMKRPDGFPIGTPGLLGFGCKCSTYIAVAYESDDVEHWKLVDEKDAKRKVQEEETKRYRELSHFYYHYVKDINNFRSDPELYEIIKVKILDFVIPGKERDYPVIRDLWIVKGAHLLSIGQVKSAFDCYNTAIKFTMSDNDFVKIYNHIAREFSKIDLFNEAIQLLSVMYAKKPLNTLNKRIVSMRKRIKK